MSPHGDDDGIVVGKAMPDVRVEAPRLLDQVRAAIRVRHYSRRREDAYVFWIRKFIRAGDVLNAHRGESKKTKDARIADSADALAEVFVSEDSRCRKRLAEFSQRCRAMSYTDFRSWALSQSW